MQAESRRSIPAWRSSGGWEQGRGVQQARVKAREVQVSRDAPRQSALPACCRSIDGNYRQLVGMARSPGGCSVVLQPVGIPPTLSSSSHIL
eukprot:753235-Hanusia_phi.AAC.1